MEAKSAEKNENAEKKATKKIKITLTSKIYDRESIEQALKDYAEVCEGRLVDDSFTVELLPKRGYEKEPVKEEFCNYVLGLMKNRGVV